MLLLAKESKFYNSKYSNLEVITSDEEIRSLPITSKEEYQLHPEDFVLKTYKKGFVHASSGSTGKPTKIHISPKSETYRRASVMRFRSWWGLDPEDKVINFTAYPRAKNSLTKK